MAHVYINNQIVGTMPLSQDDTLLFRQKDYPTLWGDLEVEVKNGKVHISKNTCPLSVCMDTGWTDEATLLIICLPNNVYVMVEAE